MKYTFVLIALGLLLLLPISVYAQASTPGYIPPGADVSTPPSCTDTEIQSAADSFLIGKVGQSYFDTHFSVRQIGGNELYAAILYEVSYTLPSGTYTLGTSMEFGDDCRTVVQASGILQPYDVVIDEITATNTVTGAGYSIDPASVQFTATSDSNPPDNRYGYRKPAWYMHAPTQNPACENGGYEGYTVYADNGNLIASSGCLILEPARTEGGETEQKTQEGATPSAAQNYWRIILIAIILIIAVLVIVYFLKKRA